MVIKEYDKTEDSAKIVHGTAETHQRVINFAFADPVASDGSV